jgi:(E)-4-hydroxy-3-methyl-but-2-enyl pyrophosphate reductase
MKKTMKIIVAESAGFCFGVRRAVEMASEALKKEKGQVFCLGEIIHNPSVISKLEKQGLKTVDDLEEVKSGEVLIIRSHGVVPEIFEEAKKRKIKIIDATCPFVKKAQKVASDFEALGRQVIIFGDPKHSEVIGIRGGAKSAIVISDEKEVLKLENFSSIGLLAQTTQKPDAFQEIVTEVSVHTNDLEIAKTICSDSFKKKEEVKKIAKEVDVMIVVGGKKSNNTKKLAETSENLGVKTFHIETAKELEEKWFLGVTKVGLVAGASTPDFSIEEVREGILKIV